MIKQILGIGESLVSRLLLFDALAMEFRNVKLRRDPNCPLCGDNPTITELIDYEEFCGAPFPGGHDGEGASDGALMAVEVKVTANFAKLIGGERSAQGGRQHDRRAARRPRPAPPRLQAERRRRRPLHRFVNIYLNDEDIRFLQQLDTPVNEGDVVSVLPALAGGSRSGCCSARPEALVAMSGDDAPESVSAPC